MYAHSSDSVASMVSTHERSLSEWAVLGRIAEGQTHGFAVSREFARDGAIGRIWTIPRPLIYRAVANLIRDGLVQEVGLAPGAGGPERRLLEVTPTGSLALEAWLEEPVAHVRDARSVLLTKLLFIDRSGADPSRLIEAQRECISPMLVGLRERVATADGFEATLSRWRLCSTEALVRFLEEEIAIRRVGSEQP